MLELLHEQAEKRGIDRSRLVRIYIAECLEKDNA